MRVEAAIDAHALRSRCQQAGQGHTMEDWDALSSKQREELAADVEVGVCAAALSPAEVHKPPAVQCNAAGTGLSFHKECFGGKLGSSI